MSLEDVEDTQAGESRQPTLLEKQKATDVPGGHGTQQLNKSIRFRLENIS
jgi:hypothetical protein